MEYRTSMFRNPLQAWANLSLRLKAFTVTALPVAALLISVFMINHMERDKDEGANTIRQTLEIRAQLQNVYIFLIAAESTVRSYALTGHEDGLQTLGTVGSSVDQAFDKVRDIVSDRPDQLARLAALRQLSHARLEGLKELHEFYEQHRADRQVPDAALQARARISPDVLLAVNSWATAQGKVLADRIKADDARHTRFQIAIGISIGIGLLGGFLAVLLFTTGVVRRVRQLESGASKLEKGNAPGLVLKGNDELGHLASAMEKAGTILSTRDRELGLALENARVLIWELDLETRRIRYRSGSAESSSILPVELLAATVEGWISAIHPDDRHAVAAEVDRVEREADALKIEYRVLIRGGETRWMMVNAQRYGSKAGRSDRLLGILADVTERRTAALEIERQARQLADSKDALEQQTRILRSILDSMGDGVVVTDTEGRFLAFNPAAQQILGKRAIAGDTRYWAENYGLFLPDGKSLYPAEALPFARAIRGESVDGAEVFIKPLGATEGSWTSVTARPLRQGDGEIRGGVMVLRDITAAKRDAEALLRATRDAEQANQAKSEFLSRMSHELRTPLNSILGFAQLLELAELGEQDRDNVEHILKGGYHLLDLINEILDLARIESGRLSISPEPVSVLGAIADALDLVRPLADERDIHIGPEVVLKADRHVRADRQRLKQVLINLLSNAIKYNRDGGSVLLACRELPGSRMRIEIIDNGRGISAEGMTKIFTPFERLAADKSEVAGTGLGLSLSKRLVEAMGGSIGVESALGVGSKFFVDLELLEDPQEVLESAPAMLELAAREPGPRRGTVLYIEDNPSNVRLIERILAHSPDVRLITALQGQVGLDLAQQHAPDWILLDMHLPDMPGEEVLSQLLDDPRTCGIPVTVLSADATRGQISRVLGSGARDYLTKPVDVRQLLRLLDQTLDRSPDDSELAELEAAHAQRDHSE